MAAAFPSKDFMSVDNFKNMIAVFKRFLQEKHSVDIDATTIDLKRTLLDTMEKVHADLHTTRSTREMNEITLKSIKNTILKALLDDPISTAVASGPSSNLSRDSALYGKRNVNSTGHILPEVSAKSEGSVMESFEQVRQARDGTPRSVQAPKAIEPFDEVKPIQGPEFQARLKALQDERKAQAVIPPVPPAPVPQAPPQALQPQAPPQLTQREAGIPDTGFGSLTTDRNSLIVDMREKAGEFDPKALFAAMSIQEVQSQQSQTQSQQSQQSQSPTDKLSVVMTPETNVPYVIQERYILANSADRDWLKQAARYKYKLRFNRSTQESERVPIYANNPVVPNTRTLTYSGVENTAGFYYNGTLYPAYDPMQGPAGDPANGFSADPVGYETIVTPVDEDANVLSVLRNIYSIQVTNVIIPMDVIVGATPFGNLETGTNTGGPKNIFNSNFNLSFPYLLLQIDEFRDVYEGTDDAIRSSFCQLVYYKSYQSYTGRGYVVLRPAQNEKKIFYPSSLSTMPSLSMSLLRPNGQLLNTSRDGLRISKIGYDTNQNALYLKISTDKYFDKNEYCQSDTVLFRGYSLIKIREEQTAADIERFNSYINREEGHCVVSLDAANSQGYYKSFWIRAPSVFNEELGMDEVDMDAVQQVKLFNDVLQNDYKEVATGYIMNMSLQNSISFRVEQRVHDTTVIGSINV